MHRARVVANRELGGGYYLLTLESPFGPEAVRPGQFVMLRAPGRLDPLLPRAFAVFDIRAGADAGPPTIDFFYHVIGKITRLMAGLAPGDELEIFGPLGNSFTVPRATRRAVIVTGEDAVEFLLVGASAVQVGTANFANPRACEEVVAGIEAYCRRHRVKKVTDLVGVLET